MAKRIISAILTLKDRNFSSGLKKGSDNTKDFQRSVKLARNEMDGFASSAVSSFTKVAKGAVGLIATATGITGLGAAVAATVNEMDTAFSRLEAKTGATGQELEELRAIATSVYKNGFGESIAQATDEVAGLNSMFRNLDYGEVQTIANGAFTISELWGAGTKEVGKAVKGMMDNFKGTSHTDALDLITTAFQKTGDYSDDLLDTFNEYSVHFSKLGLSAQEFTGILVKGAENGAFNMDKVGDAVKEFSIRAIDGSKTTKEGFATIGLSATEMAKKFGEGGESAQNAFTATIAGLATIEDPLKRNQAGVSLFGTQWEDLRDDVVLSMVDGANAVAGFRGATEKAADSMHNNFGSKMKKIWREVKVGAADAFNESGGSDILDGIATNAEKIVPKIQDLIKSSVEFGKSVHENWGTIKGVIMPIGAAIGAVYVQLGAVSAWNAAKGAMDAYKASSFATTMAQQGFNAALRANPIGVTITAITLLAGAGVALYQNWDIVREKTGQFWDKLGAFKGVATIVLGPLGQIIRTAVTMAENWDSTKSVWENVWNGIKLSASSAVNDVIGSINWLIKKINKIPGVNVPIIPKVEWGEKKVKRPQGTADFRKLDGSHATGLRRVPFDGYIAELHKDEIVLPKSDADAYRNNTEKQVTSPSTTNNSKNEISINIYAAGKSIEEIINELVPVLKLRLANM